MQRMGSPQSSGPWPIRDKHRVSTNQSWVPSCRPIPAHLGSHGAVVAEPLLVRLDDLRPGPAHTTWSPHVAISLLLDQSDLCSTNFHYYEHFIELKAKVGPKQQSSEDRQRPAKRPKDQLSQTQCYERCTLSQHWSSQVATGANEWYITRVLPVRKRRWMVVSIVAVLFRVTVVSVLAPWHSWHWHWRCCDSSFTLGSIIKTFPNIHQQQLLTWTSAKFSFQTEAGSAGAVVFCECK